jgi:hypothetical protein
MRDPSRIPRIIENLLELWKEVPDWRFCQLIENVLGCDRTSCIFHIEDTEFEERLKKFKETYG